MANYPYVGYQPNYYQQPQMTDQMNAFRQGQMQPQISQPPQMMAPMNQPPLASMVGNQGNGIIWVPNYAAANDYLVAANNAVALWDQNEPFVYLKQADSSGKPTIKAFKLVECDPNQQQNKTADIQLPDFTQFITKDELEEILDSRLKKATKTSAKKEEE